MIPPLSERVVLPLFCQISLLLLLARSLGEVFRVHSAHANLTTLFLFLSPS
jgi:hypothetical protein